MVSSTAKWLELERFRGPAEAEGRCADVTDVFVQWLSEQGIEADANPGMGTPEWYGYEREEWQDPTHAACAIAQGNYTYVIDFTAAQYDIEEFPHVRRTGDAVSDSPVWQTSWPLRPTLSDGPPQPDAGSADDLSL
jgi:hypothetical protein